MTPLVVVIIAVVFIAAASVAIYLANRRHHQQPLEATVQIPQPQNIVMPAHLDIGHHTPWWVWALIVAGVVIVATILILVWPHQNNNNGVAVQTNTATAATSSTDLGTLYGQLNSLATEKNAWDSKVSRIQQVASDLNQRAQALTGGNFITPGGSIVVVPPTTAVAPGIMDTLSAIKREVVAVNTNLTDHRKQAGRYAVKAHKEREVLRSNIGKVDGKVDKVNEGLAEANVRLARLEGMAKNVADSIATLRATLKTYLEGGNVSTTATSSITRLIEDLKQRQATINTQKAQLIEALSGVEDLD